MALCASEGHRILVLSQEPEACEEHREPLHSCWQACKAPELQDNCILLVTNSLTCNTSLDLGAVSCVVKPLRCQRGTVDEIGSLYMGFGGIAAYASGRTSMNVSLWKECEYVSNSGMALHHLSDVPAACQTTSICRRRTSRIDGNRRDRARGRDCNIENSRARHPSSTSIEAP